MATNKTRPNLHCCFVFFIFWVVFFLPPPPLPHVVDCVTVSSRPLTVFVCLSSPQTLRPQKTRPLSLWAPWKPRLGWGGLKAPIEDPQVRPSNTHTGSVGFCLPIFHILTNTVSLLTVMFIHSTMRRDNGPHLSNERRN